MTGGLARHCGAGKPADNAALGLVLFDGTRADPSSVDPVTRVGGEVAEQVVHGLIGVAGAAQRVTVTIRACGCVPFTVGAGPYGMVPLGHGVPVFPQAKRRRGRTPWVAEDG